MQGLVAKWVLGEVLGHASSASEYWNIIKVGERGGNFSRYCVFYSEMCIWEQKNLMKEASQF